MELLEAVGRDGADADRPRSVEQHSVDERIADDRELATSADGVR